MCCIYTPASYTDCYPIAVLLLNTCCIRTPATCLVNYGNCLYFSPSNYPERCTASYPDCCTASYPDCCTASYPNRCTASYPNCCTVSYPDGCTASYSNRCPRCPRYPSRSLILQWRPIAIVKRTATTAAAVTAAATHTYTTWTGCT